MNSKLKNWFLILWVQIRDMYLYFFRHAIIVNGYVDDLTWRGIRCRNWGDDLNYYFLRKLTGRPVVFYHNFRFAKWFHLKNYLCIGTLIDSKNCVNPQSIIWGSGVSGLERSFTYPAKVLALRGPKTKDFCNRYGLVCPDVYGDPALLLSLLYKPKEHHNKRKKNKIGIIPNVADIGHPVIKELKEKVNEDFELIDLSRYHKWTDVIDQICSCRCILSSSLHGIIISDVYQIPNRWIKLSGKAIVGHLKFRDYLSSVYREEMNPIVINNINELYECSTCCSYAEKQVIETLQHGLISCSPFSLRLNSLI